MHYIDIAIFVVILAGVQGLGGLAFAWDAQRRGNSPFKAFLWGVLVGPTGYLILRPHGYLEILNVAQEFTALYFLVFLLLLSILSLVRLGLGVG
jgi:hypothetical protein